MAQRPETFHPDAASAPASIQVPVQALGRAARRLERAVIVFPTDSASLGEQARARLGELQALLKQAARVRIIGYTDDVGDPSLNDRLALARAQAVTRHLRQMLGEASQTPLIASGRGLCCYLVDKQSWGARAANRRAELLMELEDTPGNAWLIERHQRLLVGPVTGSLPATAGVRRAG